MLIREKEEKLLGKKINEMSIFIGKYILKALKLCIRKVVKIKRANSNRSLKQIMTS